MRKLMAVTAVTVALAFTAGAAGGALCYALAGFAALLLPSVLCFVLGALWPR